MRKVIVELTEKDADTLAEYIQLSEAFGRTRLGNDGRELLKRLSQGVYCDIETPIPTVKRRIKTLPLTKE